MNIINGVNFPTLIGEQLRTWVDSMRKRFGKLMGNKSDAGTLRTLTDSDTWIMHLFGFLETHIVRHPGRSLGCKMISTSDLCVLLGS